MLISELMQRTQITRDTVRHYKDIGLLHDAHFCRRTNGYYDYNAGAVERIEFVKRAQRAGFTLAQIATVADEWESDMMSIDEKRQILRKQLQQIDAQIQELQQLRCEVEYKLTLDYI
jgi:DNA-binding transcriptional MerR regulator